MHLAALAVIASVATATPLAALAVIASVATATPLATRDDAPILDVPPTVKSQAFTLVVNATDLGRGFSPNIQGLSISSLHVGAGLSLLRVGGAIDNPRTFYINGTEAEWFFAASTVISDAATPPSPYSLSLVPDANSETSSTVHLDAGPGAKGIGLTRLSVPYVFLYPETYSICNESITSRQGKHSLIVKHFKQSELMTDNCVPVRLFAQCAELNELPPDAISSHQFAYETQCYEDVGSIDWSKYRPW